MDEDFLVVAGECILIVEDEERHLRPGTSCTARPGRAHAFVGAGDGPCVLVCPGNRDFDDETFWREDRTSELRRRYGVSGDQERPPTGTWKVERPPQWPDLPWS